MRRSTKGGGAGAPIGERGPELSPRRPVPPAETRSSPGSGLQARALPLPSFLLFLEQERLGSVAQAFGQLDRFGGHGFGFTRGRLQTTPQVLQVPQVVFHGCVRTHHSCRRPGLATGWRVLVAHR
jgi:hypothetical protein